MQVLTLTISIPLRFNYNSPLYKGEIDSILFQFH